MNLESLLGDSGALFAPEHATGDRGGTTFGGRISSWSVDSDAWFLLLLPIVRSRVAPQTLAASQVNLDTYRTSTDQRILFSIHMEPKVGVGVFAINSEGKFLLGERKGSHGAGKSVTPRATISPSLHSTKFHRIR